MNNKITVLFLFLWIWASCSSPTNEHFDNVQAMVKYAEDNAKAISVGDLKTMLDNKSSKFVLVDCREEAEFENGHITGAINVPRGMLEFSKKIKGVKQPLYLYSDSLNRAVLGVLALKRIGFKDVYVVKGGLQEWEKSFPDVLEKSAGEEAEEDDCG